jgi:hypothetical protein
MAAMTVSHPKRTKAKGTKRQILSARPLDRPEGQLSTHITGDTNSRRLRQASNLWTMLFFARCAAPVVNAIASDPNVCIRLRA